MTSEEKYETKIRKLYENYVDACSMCTSLNCNECNLKIFIEELSEILNISQEKAD